MKKFKLLLGALVVSALLLCLQYTAFAIPCSEGGVGGAIDCQNGFGNVDFPAPDTVNDQVFFGYDDWLYLNKYDIADDEYEMGDAYGWTVTVDGDGHTGTWSFDDLVWESFSDVMIVLKGGSGSNVNGIAFSGYLLDYMEQPTSGWWSTEGGGALSHATLYARGTGTPVPEPATMLLFGTGLIGLVGARIRRKRK